MGTGGAGSFDATALATIASTRAMRRVSCSRSTAAAAIGWSAGAPHDEQNIAAPRKTHRSRQGTEAPRLLAPGANAAALGAAARGSAGAAAR